MLKSLHGPCPQYDERMFRTLCLGTEGGTQTTTTPATTPQLTTACTTTTTGRTERVPEESLLLNMLLKVRYIDVVVRN